MGYVTSQILFMNLFNIKGMYRYNILMYHRRFLDYFFQAVMHAGY